MPDASTILLVDDEDSVQKLLAYPLERDGFRVVQARDGEEALLKFSLEAIDLVVLDVMLPKLDGLEVCKQLRAQSAVPIIMLTARDDELDKVLGLELGADDYITKPFSIREFRSRVRALMRRVTALRHDPRDGDAIEIADVRIDLARRAVDVRGENVPLTYVEFELLRTLASHPGRVYTREMLLESLWGGSEYREPRTIDVHVRHMREKIERDPREPELIFTVRGVGYRFPGPVNPFRSVGARLSLALLLVVAGALGLVYLVVVPQLQERLVSAKVAQLRRSSKLVASLPNAPFWQDWVVGASLDTQNSRVILFSTSALPSLLAQADTHGVNARDVPHSDGVALRAATSGRIQSGTVTRDGARFAEVAKPVGPGLVALYSAPLHDTLTNVALVQRRLLWAGLAALLLALLVGYGAASVFTRRIRRLERAADRIAGGRFDEPVVDRGDDELGELARAFDRMRIRLAHLDRARREFIANASHELRTPLFSLGGFLELLTDEDLDEPTRSEFLATMTEQVERLTKLASDLLDLSRLDAGRMHVEFADLDMADLARALRNEFSGVALASDHPLAVSGDDRVPARADEQRVLRIGRALVENAIAHTPAGTNVRLNAVSQNGDAVLAVEDDGPGIPADEAAQLFQRFYRLGGGRSSGSGLGLAIARELAELMGGRLELESRPGSTRFALVLPSPAAGPEEEPFSRENALAAPLE